MNNEKIYKLFLHKINNLNNLNIEELEDSFTVVLSNYSTELFFEEKYEEIYKIYFEALQIYPNSSYFWNEFGVFLQRIKYPELAFDAFEKSLKLNDENLIAFNNICNIKDELVFRWHFRMLNNNKRNIAYKNAIKNKINLGYNDVLDIGTGTGLLSIYAHQCGVNTISACDSSTIMSDIALKVFKENNLEFPIIKLYPMNSTTLQSNKQFSLIVTEILDIGVFGEGILETIIDAKKRLLKKNGQILPLSVTILISGYQSLELSASKINLNHKFTKDFQLENYLIQSENVPYESENLVEINDINFLTDIKEGLQVDFNNIDQMVNILNGKIKKQICLNIKETGYLDGFTVWFKLFVDETNIIETNPQKMNCWDQTVFKLNQRIYVNKGDTIDITMYCNNGLLDIQHKYNNTNKIVIEVEIPVIKYINDFEYLKELNKLSIYNNKLFNIAIDISPFPYLGLKLLKDKRINFLYIKNISKIVEVIMQQNESILLSKIGEINDFDMMNCIVNLLIWSPVSYIGDLDTIEVEFISKLMFEYKKNNSEFVIIPKKSNIMCQIIHSDWLRNVTKINNNELLQLKIASYLNKYETDIQFEIDNIDYADISDVINMGEINLNNIAKTKVNIVSVTLNCDKRIDGILYYFNISINDKIISTNRKFSYCNKAAFVINSNFIQNDESKDVNIKLIQNNGILKLMLC